MERSFSTNVNIIKPKAVMSKNEYYETHHFPNINPVKRSLAEQTALFDKSPILQLSSEKRKKDEFNKETVDLELENKRLKQSFFEMESNYIRQIEGVTEEIKGIKEKYKGFEGYIETLMEEKNKSIEGHQTEIKKLEGKIKELEEFNRLLRDENKKIMEKKNAMECNFIIVSIENERLNSLLVDISKNAVKNDNFEKNMKIQQIEKNFKNNEVFKNEKNYKNIEFYEKPSDVNKKSELEYWKEKYKELEKVHHSEVEAFRNIIIDLKSKRLELEQLERVADKLSIKTQNKPINEKENQRNTVSLLKEIN